MFHSQTLFNKDIQAEERIGSKKLRIVGLSDPHKALLDTVATFDSQDLVHDAVRVSGGDVDAILGEKKRVESESFQNLSSSTLLLNNAYNDDEQLGKYNLMKSRSIPYASTWYGFQFSHGFMRHTLKGGSMSVVFMDSRAINSLTAIEGFTREEFQKFEKSLGALFSYANHDYTMHRNGLVTSVSPHINDIVNLNLDIQHETEAVKGELLSGIFHKDLVDDLANSGHPILESIDSHARECLDFIEKIKDPDLKKYWLQVMKYPLFSLIGVKEKQACNNQVDKVVPEEKKLNSNDILNFLQKLLAKPMVEEEAKSDNTGNNILSQLRKDYPDVNLSMNIFGEDISATEIMFAGVSFSVRDFRKNLMSALKENDLAQFIRYLRKSGVDMSGIVLPAKLWYELKSSLRSLNPHKDSKIITENINSKIYI